MKRVLGVVAVLMALLFGRILMNGPAPTFTRSDASTPAPSRSIASDEANLEAGLQLAATKIAKEAPQRIDSNTVMTGAYASGRYIIYALSVDHEPDPSSGSLGALEEALKARLCANPQTSSLLLMGAVMAYSYTTPSGIHFDSSVDSCAPGGSANAQADDSTRANSNSPGPAQTVRLPRLEPDRPGADGISAQRQSTAKPGEAKPGEAQPGEAKPAEAKPD